ncbi:pyruvate, phosphate dikinase [Paenibacillus contaminans]|uniref:Pyruvate, phosphate dikinase n=1 Tax=Paenibacillus contaminans TaxID=450362 RepID=A0A329M5D3_9BACL|nr:pyruvate, phosphate dikinase [Paenibacillus contaminans]RAV15375.1 pyruvate, phosphate dikinase [Paenibacillus contaminans]
MKWVMPFEAGNAKLKETLGGKGANLAEMTKAGLPVPPGFTVTTDACRAFYAAGKTMPNGLLDDIRQAMTELEAKKQETFGDSERPLLVSVRSGSVSSMPGMMDTILNLGLNDVTVRGLARQTGDERFAYDCYRRLVQMFGNVVFNVESHMFEHALKRYKKDRGFTEDGEMTAADWMQMIDQYKAIIERQTNRVFPQNVYEQLALAVDAVFRSWNNQRAIVYRNLYNIPEAQGTAVNVQSMVFGNRGDDSGTGVVFTRNPSTGEAVLFGEYLTKAQGEDVVAGVRTPLAVALLQQEMPVVYDQLLETAQRLERHYKDMQDIEFTVEKGTLFILQTRNGKRTAKAAVRIAVQLEQEGLITKEEALQRIEMEHLNQLLHRAIEGEDKLDVIATGLPASPGAASGMAVFDADTAEAWGRSGKKVILVTEETSPEDIHGVIAAEGVVTSRGGMTSHAAVVARGMGKPCICGCEKLRINDEERAFVVDGVRIAEGDIISIDGATGRLIRGAVKLREPEIDGDLSQLLEWADEVRTLGVQANADNPEDAAKARQFGAEGIGLCRTEHMFMSQDRLPVVQEMILAENETDRRSALARLLPMQRADFDGMLRAMEGLPVTIRLLDPPLHEFLPNLEELLLRHQALVLGGTANEPEGEQKRLEQLIRKVRQLHESNPMLGHRGCRLGIVFPEIYEMQVEAILLAAADCKRDGVDVRPDIMVPLVGHVNELKLMRETIEAVALRVQEAAGTAVPFRIGTMIEVPRAALTAKDIAQYADFFSFGTNDLTQMTFGYSRDDAEGKFLTHYVDTKLLPANPFEVLDEDGVGQLIDLAVTKGRAANPTLKTGVCGEHGGNKQSILFCRATGVDYVSCSPYRVPLARIAAAQAELVVRDREAKAAKEAAAASEPQASGKAEEMAVR